MPSAQSNNSSSAGTGSGIAGLFQQAFAMHQAGKLNDAEMLYRIILASDPRHVDALTLLGTLHLQRSNPEEGIRLLNHSLQINPQQVIALNNLGNALKEIKRYDEACASYKRAIVIKPDYTDAYFNHGNALYELGRYNEALQSYDRAIVLAPEFAEAYNNRGAILRELGRYEEALLSYDRAVALSSGYAEAHNNRGVILKELKQNEEALVSYDKAIVLKPDYAEAYSNRGFVLRELGRNGEAMASCDRAIAVRPDYAEAHNTRGIILGDMQRYEEALACYDHAIALDSSTAGVYFNRGNALKALQRFDEALACYDHAIALRPGYADAYCNRGGVLNMQGNTGEAIRDLNEAVRISPDHAGAYFNLVYHHKPFAPDTPLFKQLESLYARRQILPPEERVLVNFAMGKTLESHERYDDAFSAYEEANRLHHLRHPFNETAEEALLERNTAFFTRELFENTELTASSSSQLDDRTPVFIVGMPRSGTSLIEQILASHPSLFGAGELMLLEYLTRGISLPTVGSREWETEQPVLAKLGQEYLDKAWQLAPQARFITDKMPGNYRHLGLLHLMLPNARIIHAMRDPMDSCFSCYAMYFQGHDYSYNLGALGRYYRRYIQLMRHWHSVLPPGRILDVRYEDMVADPEREARRVLKYLDLPWDPSCLRFHENKRTVGTASVSQVRTPIYTSSVARWKHFERHLGALLDLVGEYR